MIKKLTDNISRVIVGKDEIVKLMITAMISGGHILLEDMPGSGKTKLAKSLAASLDAEFSRIQFTPDLLPTDITGLNVYNKAQGVFELRKGPIFANIILADEINRATPRTQAGLLESMEERQVTIDGETYKFAEPFFVIATQNPIETSGTFPLPEAQLDRFLMKISMGGLSYDEELSVMDRYMKEDPLSELKSVLTKEDVLSMRESAENVYVSEGVRKYILDIVTATRKHAGVLAGASTRGTLALLNAAKAYAYVSGRDYVIPDDVSALSVPVLAHRLVLSLGRGSSGAEAGIIRDILKETVKPTESFTAGRER
ncbi:MAG: MoxR family ATPase [Lachnospiraceae bacterium]|nr:MoxR family ATPase [Lachnospiraceae bacterium]